MKKYLFFENLYKGRAIEKSFYTFCLRCQPDLIRFLPLYLWFSLLRYFRIIGKEKYLSERWSFLSSVKDLEEKREKFFAKRSKKLFIPHDDICVISEHPRVMLENAFPKLIANVYDLQERSFSSFKSVKELASQEEYEAYGTLLSPLMKNAKAKHYIYGKREYVSPYIYIAKTILHYGVSYALITVFALFIGVCSLYFGCRNHVNHASLFFSYLERPTVLALNIIPVVFIVWLMYFITNSTALSCFIGGGTVMLLSWINYYKLFFRNDPFLFGDIAIAGEAKVMTESYKVVLTPLIIALMAAIILFTLFMAVYFRARIKNSLVRLCLVVLALIVGFGGYNKVYTDLDTYTEALDVSYIKMWSPTDQFISRGFLYPFIYSAQTAFDTPPEGYSKEEARDILSQYTYTDIPEDKRVSIISVMLESWGDLSKFESVEFENDPYEMLEPLYQSSYHGELVTDIFAAGTVRSERQFLTGYTELSSFRKATNSVVWYFKDQGYIVEGGHPSYDWFYNRKNINMNLGFEEYYFDDNRYMGLNDGIRLANNDVLFSDIMDSYDSAVKKGENYFNFSVTYEGHGPYAYDVQYEAPYIVNKGYSESAYNNVNNYLATIESVNGSVLWLADEVCKREEPVVLILFGDHMPGLGENNSAYSELGINIDLSTTEGLLNYYSTPYFIVANDAAKKTLGCDFTGEGPDMGPYFLMNEFFKLAGYTGDEYMQYTSDIYKEYQVCHCTGLIGKNGEYYMGDSAATEFARVEYYRKNSFVYG